MPYDAEHLEALPSNVQELPEAQRRQWVAIWNSTYASCQKESGKDCEERAFRVAHGVLRKRSGEDDELAEAPDVSAILPEALPAGLRASMQRYLSKLYSLIRQKAKDGELTPEEFETACKSAAGHAGGTARTAQKELREPYSFYLAAQTYAEAPEWIPYLPKPGSYQHPRWGAVVVSPERNQRFVQNFQQKVYQDRLPLDAEHQTKLSGALGWLTEMRLNADGSADARIEWTERGKTLVADGGFRYVSPEWYDEWEDPATRQKYQDVAIGGALTTRPFYKENALRPLIATEQGVLIDLGSETEPMTVLLPGKQEQKEVPNVSEDARQEVSEQAAKFTELQTKLTLLEAERDTAKQMVEEHATAVKTATERIALLEQEARRKRFTDLVMGRGDESDGLRWYGEPSRNVALLERMAGVLGEQSEAFQDYLAQQRALTEQLRQSGLFTEVGSSAIGAATTAYGKIEAMAKTLVAEGTVSTLAQGVARVATENPELYRAYRAGE